MKYRLPSKYVLTKKIDVVLENESIEDDFDQIKPNDLVIVHPTKHSRIQEKYEAHITFNKTQQFYTVVPTLEFIWINNSELNEYMLNRIELKHRDGISSNV